MLIDNKLNQESTDMLQQVVRVGSIFLVVSACLCSMERPSLKQLAIKKVAELIADNPNPGYYVKAFDSFPRKLGASIIQQLVATNRPKSALPIALLSYKLHQQQQQKNTNKHILRLMLSNDQQVPFTSEQSDQLIQNSATIQNLVQDLEEQVEEIPLPLLTQEQVTVLLSYIPIINALNTSDSTLSTVQQEMPEATALSSYYLKYTALYQLKEYLTAHTVPVLCDLIIAASYLDIQNSEQAINFIELTTHVLGDKLLQLPHYQDEYTIINTLPSDVQRKLVCYLIDISALRYALCGNSTDVITNTVQTLSGHTDSVNSVSWSPDGKYIASGSHDETIKIWNTTTGACMLTLMDSISCIGSVSWSPDGKHIASSCDNGIIKIWDVRTGNRIHTLIGDTNNVDLVSWSPDGKSIAGASYEDIIIWDTTTGACMHNLMGKTGSIQSISWSPDNMYIASCSFDKTVKIWSASTDTCIRTLIGHTGIVWSVSWSPDGKYIASASGYYDDGEIKIWNAITGICIRTLKGHIHNARSVSWSPDGKHIANNSNGIQIWDAITGACIHTLKGYRYFGVNSVAWSPDGTTIAGYSNEYIIRLWSIIDKNSDNYLKTTISWEQALLLVRIINKQDIDFTEDKQALHCYNSLPENIKQFVEPLLSKDMRIALDIALHEDVLPRKTKKLRKE